MDLPFPKGVGRYLIRTIMKGVRIANQRNNANKMFIWDTIFTLKTCMN